jgi:cytochrome c oxidase subunit 3/cytochrome o ubiquinol oxidase subunit 3
MAHASDGALAADQTWTLPSKGHVAMVALIIAEATIFTIFVVAYLFYVGKSLSGPQPRDVLRVPVFYTACLLSSSITIHAATSALRRANVFAFGSWWLATIVLGAIFLAGTVLEWWRLIFRDGLTISTNLFGTTYYSLVGLHGSHVVIGLILLGIVMALCLGKRIGREHAEHIDVLALYWHFVDAVWVVVFTVVYIVGR